MAWLDEDLNGDGIIEPGEQPPPAPVQTTAAPADPAPPPAADPAAPATPAASTLPPWLQQFRAAQDARRNDFRTGMDQFYGGLGKLFDGDLKGGFGQWQAHHDQRRTDFRNKLNDRFDKIGDRFQMPPGFASRLPWNQGKSGASGLGGSIPAQGVAPGEPNPAKPNDTPAQGAAKAGAWWAGGWGGGKNRQGKGLGHKPQSKPAAQPTTPATPTPEEDEEP